MRMSRRQTARKRRDRSSSGNHAAPFPVAGPSGSYVIAMELTGVGGGLMLAIAAALWLVYLVPNWFKRREYLATERNAVRLQQTIRVLAETAEVPAAVRAEAAARQVALQQRAEYRQGPVAVGRPVQRAQPTPAQVASASRRVRRTRAATTFVLLVSLVTAFAQV